MYSIMQNSITRQRLVKSGLPLEVSMGNFLVFAQGYLLDSHYKYAKFEQLERLPRP